MSFETDVARLEGIVRELERDDLELERALSLFEEGIARLRAATASLASADGRVQELVELVDGSFALTGADDADDESGDETSDDTNDAVDDS